MIPCRVFVSVTLPFLTLSRNFSSMFPPFSYPGNEQILRWRSNPIRGRKLYPHARSEDRNNRSERNRKEYSASTACRCVTKSSAILCHHPFKHWKEKSNPSVVVFTTPPNSSKNAPFPSARTFSNPSSVRHQTLIP